MRLKWPNSKDNLNKAQFIKVSIFGGQKFTLRHYYIQNVKNGIQIRVYKINKESVPHFRQLISVNVTKILRKSHAQFRGKLRKLKVRQNDGFLTKRRAFDT